MKKNIIFAVVSILVVIGVLFTFNPFNENDSYSDSNVSNDSKPEIKTAEESRETFQLGFLYYSHYNDDLDYSKAVQLFKESSDSGDPLGTFWLGRAYYDGNGFDVDREKGEEYISSTVEWLLNDSDSDDPMIQEMIGYIYEYGIGLEKDIPSALKYYELASSQGNSNAQYALGVLYYYGHEVTRDREKSKQYFELSASNGNPMSMYMLGFMYWFGYGTDIDYEKSESFFRASLDWMENASYQGSPTAQCNLGIFYSMKFYNEPDYVKALELLQKSANQQNGEALNDLGIMFSFGEGVERNEDIAKRYYKESALENDVYGLCNYAHCLMDDGEYESAIKLYERSARKNNPGALRSLANIYEEGNGVAIDLEKAQKLREKATLLEN